MATQTVYNLFGWGNKGEDNTKLEEEEWQSQQQWERDFEQGEEGIIGELRQRIREAKQRQVTAENGVNVEVRDLQYISPPLHTQIDTVPSYILQKINIFKRVKDTIYPDVSKQHSILSNINYSIREGTMTLILGSPESGKTSLCKILANQELSGKVYGEILFGGKPIVKKDHTHRVAYVRDCDTHLAHLTVKQTFEFAYSLLTPSFTTEDRERFINALMTILGLTHRANTIVGDDLTRGISGGERRRVTVGVELLKRCQLLILDEATTGLDSTTSLQIFRALRIIADELAPIFATLKQPGRELYNLFDNIIVMHEGCFVYSGPREDMIPYFQENGYSFNKIVNPADEVLNLVERYGNELVTLYAQLNNHHIGDLKKSKSMKKSIDEYEEDEEAPQLRYKEYSRSMISEIYWGVKRGAQLFKNNPGVYLSRVVFAMIMSAIIGTLFLQLGDNQAAISSIRGSLFIVATFPAFQAIASLPTLYAGRPVFYYQKKNKYFRPLSMLIADFAILSPIILVESVMFSTICYWLIGLNSSFFRYFIFVVLVFSLELLFTIITTISGFLLPSFQVASIIVPPYVFMMNFFAGFAITQDRAPKYIQWMFWVSPFRYLLEALTINQFEGTTFECDDDELVPPNNDPLLHAPFSAGGYEGNQVCPIQTGEQILLSSDFHTEYEYTYYWMLVMFGLIILSFIIMTFSSYIEYKKKPPRNMKEVQEQRTKNNEKIINLKSSVRSSFVRLNPALDSSMGSEDSEDSLINALHVDSNGKRIETNIPIYLEWKNVSYTVKVPQTKGIGAKLSQIPIVSRFFQQDLTLVNSVSGFVSPGMLIAFMGPSGAGKTTLLDVLAQRKTAGKLEGEILINGAPLDADTLSRFAGYVEQQNIHIESETVEEAIKMSAALRLTYPGSSKRISRHDRLEHILWVMGVLQLTPLRDALISELSLEQKKRLTIGIELAANPSLLWLDEPTSGLDSIAAMRVMKTIRNIASCGVAVVCTLHQPSELIFSWCSHLLLLAPGGNMVYFGDTADASHEIIQHFSTFGLEPGHEQNPADFFLDCCSSKSTNPEGKTPIEAFKDSQSFKNVEISLEQGTIPKTTYEVQPFYKRINPFCSSKKVPIQEDPSDQREVHFPPSYTSNYSATPISQAVYLISRNFRVWWRSPVPLLIVLLNSTLFGLILGLLFADIDDSQSGAIETTSLYFFMGLVLSTSVMAFLPQLFAERATFYRETASKEYHPAVYLGSMLCVNLPLKFIADCILISIAVCMCPIRSDWYSLVYLYGVGCSMGIAAYSILVAISCLAPVAEVGNGVFSVYNMLSVFSNGFLIVNSLIPSYWIWLYWIGYQHYTLEGLLLNELDGQKFYCKDNEGAIPVLVPSDTEPYRYQYYCQITSGEDIFENLDMHEDWKAIDFAVLVGIAVALFSLSAIIITKVRHIQR